MLLKDLEPLLRGFNKITLIEHHGTVVTCTIDELKDIGEDWLESEVKIIDLDERIIVVY